eukprot:6768458-Prymnesium_polylepis.1
MPPAATAEPHAPRKIIDGGWAHARGLGGMMHMCSPPMSLSPRQVYLPCSSASSAMCGRSGRVYVAACVERVPVKEPSRG